MTISMEHKVVEILETKEEIMLRKVALYMTAVFFTFTGARHLIYPKFFMIFIPNYFPVPLFLVYFTGLFQIVCAVGLVMKKFRKFAAYGHMAFLIAVLPVHVYLWTLNDNVHYQWAPSWIQMLSIPLQFFLIFWVYLFAQKPNSY